MIANALVICLCQTMVIKSLFWSVIAVVFLSVFYAEMHQNNIFFIFKKIFLKSAYQNDSKHTK
jgi:hypothetical protein